MGSNADLGWNDELAERNSISQVEFLAEELQHRTTLSNRECIVLAGDKVGLEDKEIAQLIHRGRSTVHRTRSKMRKKYREMDAATQEQEDTKTELSFYFGE